MKKSRGTGRFRTDRGKARGLRGKGRRMGIARALGTVMSPKKGEQILRVSRGIKGEKGDGRVGL